MVIPPGNIFLFYLEVIGCDTSFFSHNLYGIRTIYFVYFIIVAITYGYTAFIDESDRWLKFAKALKDNKLPILL